MSGASMGMEFRPQASIQGKTTRNTPTSKQITTTSSPSNFEVVERLGGSGGGRFKSTSETAGSKGVGSLCGGIIKPPPLRTASLVERLAQTYNDAAKWDRAAQ